MRGRCLYKNSYCERFLNRMKSLEQDALKAQMVIAKSRDSKKRGALDQLTESPSPAPTPSPTPMEGKALLPERFMLKEAFLNIYCYILVDQV